MDAYPVKISDLSYFIDIDTWRGQDIIDFSPRASVPGTGQIFSDLGLYQPIVQTNWQEGLGFVWHDSESGYLETIGDMDTRHKGFVQRMTQSVSGETNNNVKNGGVVFGSYTYFWGVAGVRRVNTSDVWGAIEVMRPIYDAHSSGTGDAVASAGTVTVSHTVTAAGGDAAVLVAVGINDSGNVTDVTATYGGTSMTALGTTIGATPHCRGFYLANPTTGSAQDCVVTFTISSGTIEVVVGVHSFINVHQSTLFSTIESVSPGSVTSITDDTTGTRDRELVLCFTVKDGGTGDAQAEGSGDTAMVETANDSTITLMTSREYVIGTGQTTMGWSWTNSRTAVQLTFALEMVAEVEVNFMLQNGAQLFAAPNGKRLMRIASADAGGGTDWIPAGVNNNSQDYKWGLIHGGYIYWGKDGDTDVYYDNDDALAALAGDPGDVTTEIPVGAGTIATIGGISFIEKIAVSRDDGLYMIGDDNIARLKLGFVNDSSSNNFRSMAIFGGELFFPIRDQLLRWNGARVVDVTPGRMTDVFPYKSYGRFDNLVALQNWLFCSARTNDSTYEEDILAWDGSAWHKIVDGAVTNGSDQVTMIMFDPLNNRLWYHIQASTDDTRYVAFQNNSMFPSDNYSTTGTHELRTSRIHAGFRRITKSVPYLFVEVDNVDVTRYIEVYYNIDGDGWILWDTVNVDGVTKLSFPTGSEPTVEFEYIQLAFRLICTATSSSPVLEGFALMLMLRPEVRYGYNFDVYAANNLSAGYIEDGRTGGQIMADLRTARNSKKPVSLVTPFGDTILGYITSISEHAIEYEPDDIQGGNIQQIIRISFVTAVEQGVGNAQASGLLLGVGIGGNPTGTTRSN